MLQAAKNRQIEVKLLESEKSICVPAKISPRKFYYTLQQCTYHIVHLSCDYELFKGFIYFYKWSTQLFAKAHKILNAIFQVSTGAELITALSRC